MKAHVIISSEYKYNEPSVFCMDEYGEYFGCLIYPNHRKFPKDINYWKSATCADDNRHFEVIDIYLEREHYLKLLELKLLKERCNALIKPLSVWRRALTKEQSKAIEAEDRKRIAYNAPYWAAQEAAHKEETNILLMAAGKTS